MSTTISIRPRHRFVSRTGRSLRRRAMLTACAAAVSLAACSGSDAGSETSDAPVGSAASPDATGSPDLSEADGPFCDAVDSIAAASDEDFIYSDDGVQAIRTLGETGEGDVATTFANLAEAIEGVRAVAPDDGGAISFDDVTPEQESALTELFELIEDPDTDQAFADVEARALEQCDVDLAGGD